MDAQLGARPPPGALVKSFAEFPLIPDLLCLYDPEGGNWEKEWAHFMDMWQCDMDHIEDRHLPVGMAVIKGMVEDAFQFCRRIGLIGPRGGVSSAGRRLIELSNRVQIGDSHHEHVLAKTLAIQIHSNFRGAGGLRITELVQAAATVLSSYAYDWPRGLEGLMLGELETLLHWGSIDATRAERLVHQLPEIRLETLEAIRRVPSREVMDEDGHLDSIIVATTLCEIHWSRDDLALNSELDTTSVRATAMALIYAQLVAETVIEKSLTVLRPWQRN